ncbi:MAG: CBS domain-containing protein [Nitrosopumilus sp.]|nr:CBS domain-containing protein [Nitrosopumilus sp.]
MSMRCLILQCDSLYLISIDSNSDLWMVSDLMSARNVRKLPVITNDRVFGIITTSDMVKHIADH